MAHTPGTAPLWLACMLKESQQARIVCPPWMDRQSLEDRVKDERERIEFSRLPYHFVEIAELLLRYARDDIASADRVEALLAEVQALREAKVQAAGRKILATAGGRGDSGGGSGSNDRDAMTAINENVNVTSAGAMDVNMFREGSMKVRVFLCVCFLEYACVMCVVYIGGGRTKHVLFYLIIFFSPLFFFLSMCAGDGRDCRIQ
jgi:hypothetical protein